jgi:lambda family phage portal protein
MNLIDRTIEAIAPGWAVQRAVARERLATHRGGVSTRVSRQWGQSQSIRGGTAAQRWNQAARRDRARKVYAEHPIGRSLLKTETDNVVSCGFTLQAKALNQDGTAAEEFNAESEDRFSEWLEIADIRGMLGATDLIRQFYRSPRRDGDGGIVLVDQGGGSRLQYIPGDLICNPMGKIGPNMIDGVEVDAVSRPIAFHVKSQNEWGKLDFQRVPANNFIFLAPEIDDDLGIRGDSCYSTIFNPLDQIDGYIDAVIIAARMAAVFGLIIKEETAAAQFAGLQAITNSQGNQQKAVTLENGQLKYQGTAESVVQVVPQQPMNQTPDFIRTICRLLGLPFDMPLELVFKDLSQTNFSSARIGLIGYYRACRARQRAFMRRCLTRIYRWWLLREIKMQRILAPIPFEPLAHIFMAEGWDYTDPVSEMQADLLAIDLGIKTPQQCTAERGRDYEENIAQIRAANKIRQLAKLADIGSSMTRDRVPGGIQLTLPAPAKEDDDGKEE